MSTKWNILIDESEFDDEEIKKSVNNFEMTVSLSFANY